MIISAKSTMIPSKVMLTRAPVPRRAVPNPEMLTMRGRATSSHLQRCRVPAQQVWNVEVAVGANGLIVLFAFLCKYQHYECNAPAMENIQRFQFFFIRNISHIISFFSQWGTLKKCYDISYSVIFFSQIDTSGSLSRTNMESWCHLLTLMLCHWPGMIWKKIF